MKKYIATFATALTLSACGDKTATKTVELKPAETKPAAQMDPVERGAKIFTRCQACHTLNDGGRNKLGPNLWNIYGAQAAAKEQFAYSKAMKASGLVWDETTMDAYLTKPAKYMPGTKMTFIGLKKQQDRDAVQAYIKSKTTP